MNLDEAIAKVQTFRDLEPDWDSYGGEPACEEAITFTTKLLGQVKRMDHHSLIRVVPISTGCSLEFGDTHRFFHIEVDDESVLVSSYLDSKCILAKEYSLRCWHAVTNVLLAFENHVEES